MWQIMKDKKAVPLSVCNLKFYSLRPLRKLAGLKDLECSVGRWVAGLQGPKAIFDR